MSGLKKKKEKRPKKPQQVDGDEIDERFSAALNRPQFARVKEKSNKVVLDDRFASVLTDPRFRLQEKDKYGRKKKKKNKIDATNELEAFYTVEQEETEQNHDRDEKEAATENAESQKDTEESSEDEAEDPASRIAYLNALSRGEVDLSSSSEDDASSEEESDLDSVSDEDPVSGKAGILDPSNKDEDGVSITEIASPYMAVMNMDWSHVRAVDIFAIFSSFTPPGSVKKVQVYPSDFGTQQMAKELTEGPSDIWKREKSQSDSDNDSKSHNEESGSDDEASKTDMEIGTGDFDPEKLRAYEASKLKYYFAVVEFTSASVADMAYKEVDGLELEHSSAAMDIRCIDPEQLSGVIEGRKLRDEAKTLPSKYDPPEFVVSALQQTSVHCTWEDGDMDRERKLTRYSQQKEWGAMAEGEDLAAYLASDNSSVGSGDESSDADDEKGEEKKGSKLRKMLGLDSDDEDDGGISDDDNDVEDDGEKTATFVPGKNTLEEKIRTKLESKEDVELTPWEKYQEKRKQKRREKRQATRSKRGTKTASSEDDGMYGEDPEFGQAEFEDGDGDDFFVDERDESESKSKKPNRKGKIETTNVTPAKERVPSTKAELELLLAGDNEEEETKDYDMRGIIRMDKNKDKKLKGARKRKEAIVAANTSGADFKIDVADDRFAAVLKGSDDRFGIDRTDSNYKDTEAMRTILSEQMKQRRARKKAKASHVVGDVSAEAVTKNSSTGASALSSLVKSLKSKVAKKSQ